jgi:hypothetical protein
MLYGAPQNQCADQSTADAMDACATARLLQIAAASRKQRTHAAMDTCTALQGVAPAQLPWHAILTRAVSAFVLRQRRDTQSSA